jgi:Protein of unknown function (DUF1761)
MALENLNLLGAVVAAVAAMAIGALWYSPLLFAKRWQELIGRSDEELGGPGPAMAIASLMFVLLGIGLAWVMPNDASIGVGAMWGFLAFWGFALPITVVNSAFERRSWSLVAIYLGYILVAMLVMGAIIALLGG